MHKEDYSLKMTEILADTNIYQIVDYNPTKNYFQNYELQNLLTRWKKKQYINIYIYKKLLVTDGILPRAYGLPEINKPNNSLRIIIFFL